MLILKKTVSSLICFLNENVLARFFKKPVVLNRDDTVKNIIENNYSVSRFGDGEFNIILGGSIKFQDFDHELSTRLKNILRSNQSNHLVCIPNVFDSLQCFEDKAHRFWSDYISRNRFTLYRILSRDKVYGDTQVTRPYMDRLDKENSEAHFESLKRIWKDRDLLIVEGRYSRLGVGNDLFKNANSTKRILCPEKNSYSCYSEIYKATKALNENRLVLLAIGPTATVLANDLTFDGIQAIDIGHLDVEYEWMKMKVNEKTNIVNKSVNEVNDNSSFDHLDDFHYQKEIILEIKI